MRAIDTANLLREARLKAGLSQRKLAELAETAQSVVARIEAGLTSPTVATMERLLAVAGFQIEVVPKTPAIHDPVTEAFKRDIDRTLLRENLSKTPEQRVRALQALSRLASEARSAGSLTRARTGRQ